MSCAASFCYSLEWVFCWEAKIPTSDAKAMAWLQQNLAENVTWTTFCQNTGRAAPGFCVLLVTVEVR